ncbi:MAG: helix-turn-helix domain-containing protein, partial [Pyrinomonadaceae bacterium]
EIGLEHLSDRITGALADANKEDSDPETLEEVERRYVLAVLTGVDGDKASAAKILGIDLSTLYRKMKRYELDQTI